MSNIKCNGWSNYATWSINVEILGDVDFDHPVTYDYLEDYVNEIVFNNQTHENARLMNEFARSFISQVDFRELAEAINSDLEIQNKYEN